MNPQSLGAAAAVVAVAFWLLSRRRPSPLVGLDASAVALLNRTQIELVHEAAAAQASAQGSAPALPTSSREQGALLRLLGQQLAGDTASRLAAMQTARAWGHRCTLPLLGRGLRDVNPQVVHEAAQAMEMFRGQSAAASVATASGGKAQGRLPRNAALTR